jgi:hypothetical protein
MTSDSPETTATTSRIVTIAAKRASRTWLRVTGLASRYSSPPVSSSPAIAATPRTTPSASSIQG